MGRVRTFDLEERLDRAVDAFWEHGFEGSALTALCKTMGLFPGSLYGTYGDKRRLYVLAIDRYMSTVSAEAVEILGRDASGLGALRAYFSKLIDGMVDGKRQWGCLITNTIVELAQRDAEVKAKVDLHLARLETALAGAIARARQAGEIPAAIRAGTPLEDAAFLVCVVQGLNVLAKTRPSRQRLEMVAATALAALGVERNAG
ncbi:TetR family transcriptional regulator [Aliidongia dinghuensis]|uniref:TetR family transcriptional regulator n=1 Tax=Aliidongia dinghuensis TaxID=1867774 RepID=A0A8J2Z1I3_9PROT|nr:TetR/AcrR family transcriptional regulator [Aliidongia dinghuensis]GGF47528.1 TetR family transcriptional regulator [Aliidongia dinghuensis]